MAKFNIFDEGTWDIEIQDMEKLLRNKALGQIGQLISEIRELFDVINNYQLKSAENNQELKIALDLQQGNPIAFKIMDVTIHYSDSEVAEILDLINKVLEFWKDKEEREANWRYAVSLIKPLKPYLDKNKWSSYDTREVEIHKLVSVKITGNEAWNIYLSVQKNALYWMKQYEAARPKIYYPGADID